MLKHAQASGWKMVAQVMHPDTTRLAATLPQLALHAGMGALSGGITGYKAQKPTLLGKDHRLRNTMLGAGIGGIGGAALGTGLSGMGPKVGGTKEAINPTAVAGGVPLLGPGLANMTEGGPAPTMAMMGSALGQGLGGLAGGALGQSDVMHKFLRSQLGRRRGNQVQDFMQYAAPIAGTMLGGGLGASLGASGGHALSQHWANRIPQQPQ